MDVHGKNPDLNVNKVDSKPSTSVSFLNKVKSAAMAPIKHLKNEIQHQVANFNDQKLITVLVKNWGESPT